MHEDIHARTDVQMAQLQCARQRDNHGGVHLAQAPLSLGQVLGAFFKLFHQQGRRQWFRRYSTRQRRVIVYVELQQVEELVVDLGNGAVDVLLNTE